MTDTQSKQDLETLAEQLNPRIKYFDPLKLADQTVSPYRAPRSKISLSMFDPRALRPSPPVLGHVELRDHWLFARGRDEAWPHSDARIPRLVPPGANESFPSSSTPSRPMHSS